MKYALGSRQTGFSLVEVLVALIILAIGIMGLISMQMGTLQSNQAVSYRSQAVWAASDIMERMRLNRGAVTSGLYDIPMDSDGPTASSGVSAGDLNDWLDFLETWLPEGDGEINYDASSRNVTITIQWDDSAMRDGDTEKQFVFETQI